MKTKYIDEFRNEEEIKEVTEKAKEQAQTFKPAAIQVMYQQTGYQQPAYAPPPAYGYQQPAYGYAQPGYGQAAYAQQQQYAAAYQAQAAQAQYQ